MDVSQHTVLTRIYILSSPESPHHLREKTQSPPDYESVMNSKETLQQSESSDEQIQGAGRRTETTQTNGNELQLRPPSYQQWRSMQELS